MKGSKKTSKHKKEELPVKTISETELATVLSGDIDFSGDLISQEPVLIKCKFSGSVHSDMEVYVSKKAFLKAKVYAKKISIHGHLEGDVNAKDIVELFSTAVLKGNISTCQLITQRGACFTGKCQMPEVQE